AGVTAEQLPELVPTTQALPLAAAPAARVGLPAGTPVVVGGGDRPLANLGVRAVRPGMAACSLGTSGALRVVVDRPVVDPAGRVFCYALAPGLWSSGERSPTAGSSCGGRSRRSPRTWARAPRRRCWPWRRRHRPAAAAC